jgi:hypothetical protein
MLEPENGRQLDAHMSALLVRGGTVVDGTGAPASWVV